MKNNTKKILVLSLLGLFIFVFALQFVSAAEDPVADLFQKWFAGEGVGETFAKVIFFIIVLIIIQSIGESVPGLESAFKNNLVGWVLSGLISFLAIAYITPDQIYTMMIGYSAMGYVLAGGLPFLLLLGYTYKMAIKSGNAGERLGRKLFSYIMWGGFTLFSAYRLLAGYAEDPESLNIVFALMFPIGGALMLIFNGTIFNRISDARNEEVRKVAGDKMQNAAKAIHQLNKVEENLGGVDEE